MHASLVITEYKTTNVKPTLINININRQYNLRTIDLSSFLSYVFFRIRMVFCLFIFMLINVGFALVVLYPVNTKDTCIVLLSLFLHCFYCMFLEVLNTNKQN